MALDKLQRKHFLLRHKVWVFAFVTLLLLVAAVYIWLTQDEPGKAGRQEPKSAQVIDLPKEDPEPVLAKINPQKPVRIAISDIEVDAPVIPVGTEPDGAMSAPRSSTDIGWYERSALLGSEDKAMLLSGHYGLEHLPEVLHRLNELEKGDTITVTGSNKDTAVFKVVETETQNRHKVDMEKAFRYAKGQESMSIITCIGEFDHSIGTYDKRHIVYAVRIE